MAYEHKEGQGSLFKNEKQNDRQPDYKGTILIGGVTYEVAAWERTSQRGSKYLSLQASMPRERSEQDAAPRPQYNRPQAPSYQPSYQPSMPEPAPMPTIDDMPPFGPADDLPF